MIKTICAELSVSEKQVVSVLKLLEEGATIPFIARYRKEATGSLDEVAIAAIRDRHKDIAELEKRRSFILDSILAQGKLTEELKALLLDAKTATRLEDIYLPFKPKRRTRAMIAREKGLEPLAQMILEGNIDPFKKAEDFLDAQKGVGFVEEALSGARDIIAEMVNEDEQSRASVRTEYVKSAFLVSSVKKAMEEKGVKFRDYFEYKENVHHAAAHRILAVTRGENEGILSVSIEVDEERCGRKLSDIWIKSRNACMEQISLALEDSLKRLMYPSLENELLSKIRKEAEITSIKIFATNLREILLESPFGSKSILAVDPGFRAGCKIAMIDDRGGLMAHDVIYPHEPQKKTAVAAEIVLKWISQYQPKAIAVGNGTAGRESVDFLESLGTKVPVVMVNESGASVYSASETARKEFPEEDVLVRGAVSIGRRLADPLAELVKIDPKAIGVGQYQHDVDQALLKQSLEETVISCVNSVGVELNTASEELLQYVSGLNKKSAAQIIKYRKEKGVFTDRQELKKVSGLGEKAFEQAAGFLRIKDGVNILDCSGVHPESYAVVEMMARDLGCPIKELIKDREKIRSIDPKKYVTEKTGLPTLRDIIAELEKPGRDPREEFSLPSFDSAVHKPEDLKEGMVLEGIVTNVSAFGAFVDIGVHQDGLVHVSEISDTFVKDIHALIKARQKVRVRVLSVDLGRKRISLSMKGILK
jgi:uncharacterized protein